MPHRTHGSENEARAATYSSQIEPQPSIRKPHAIVSKAAIAVGVLLLLSPFFAGFLAHRKLESAVDALDSARQELVAGEGNIEGSLRSAISDAEQGRRLMADPLLRGLAAVTGTGD